jgi:cytochrome c peroxidase
VLVLAAFFASAEAGFAQTPDQIGDWGPVLDWGVQAKHMILLPTGEVLVWSTGEDARVWDPSTDSIFTPTPFSNGDLHCASQTTLADGRILIAGGQGGETHEGIPVAALFDPFAKTWTSGADMNQARWYATLLSLDDGRVVVTTGDDENKERVLEPEIYDPVADTWTTLTGAARADTLYTFMYQLPDGRIYQAGPNTKTWFLDTTGNGSWTEGPRNVIGASGYSVSSAMIRPGVILNAGGGDPAYPDAAIIDMNQASPAWRSTAPMNFARRRHDLTILPDGTVLAVGGTGRADDDAFAILEAELFDPDTETWTVMDAMVEERMYHSSTVLLPDGRIVAGGGEGGERRKHAQVFSPPYLFKGSRPAITNAPEALAYGQTFVVSTPDAASIASVALLRSAGSTHTYDQSQRFVPLDFVASNGELQIDAPSDAFAAAPGYFMLFLVNDAGVPSVAPFVRLAELEDLIPGSLTGFVRDAFGEPIEGAQVSYPGSTTVSDATGAYGFAVVVAGTHTLTVTAPGYATQSRSVLVESGPATPSDFALELSGMLIGRITAEATGLPIAGANVEYPGGAVVTNANGDYLILDIAEGEQVVKATAVTFEGLEISVTIVAGDTTTADFNLHPGHTVIEGEVLDAETLEPIPFSTVSYSGGTQTTDAFGFFFFDEVAEGTYLVTASAEGYFAGSAETLVITGFESTVDFALDRIPGPVETFIADQDAKVKSSSPTTNYGSAADLRVRFVPAGDIWESYIQFSIGASAASAGSASVRLFVTDSTPDGGVLYAVGTPIDETQITYGNAPTCRGVPIASAGAITAGEWVEFDVTAAITTSDVQTFCLASDNTNSGFYSSKEGNNPPELVIERIGGCVVDTDCSDGFFCNGDEVCNAGTCEAGPARLCADGIACTRDSCDVEIDACRADADAALCNDGFFCNGAEVCDVVLGCLDAASPACGGGACDDAFDVCTDAGGSGGPLILSEVASGATVESDSISTSAALTATANDLYIATISTNPHRSVVSVTGLGLSWSPLVEQCGGRSATGLAVWVAQGDAIADEAVTSQFSETVRSAALAVVRYEDAPIDAIDQLLAANSNGTSGACSGGTDELDWSLPIATGAPASTTFVAVARGHRSHVPSGFDEITNISAGTGGDTTGLVVGDQVFEFPTTANLGGSFSGPTDWAAIVIELAAGPVVDFTRMPPVPVPVENPITEEKRILGKILFWEEQLSANDKVACGTCHEPFAGGGDARDGTHPGPDGVFDNDDDIFGSPGVPLADAQNVPIAHPDFDFEPQVTRRAAPTVIGAQFAHALFVDGSASSHFVDPVSGLDLIASHGALESQAVRPPLGTAEMGHEGRDWNAVVTKLENVNVLELASNFPADIENALADSPGYPDLFAAAFADPAITPARIAFAIATYERTLVADQTPWDRYMAGETEALTPNQERGWNAFRVSLCATCHIPPLFTAGHFHNIGVRPPEEDTGRQGVTGLAGHRGRFKTPTLRNAGLRTSFMHNGRFPTLASAVDFYLDDRGNQFLENLDPLMPLVDVPVDDVLPMIDFLENSLTDPRVENETFPFDRPTITGLPEPKVAIQLLVGSGLLMAIRARQIRLGRS